MKALKLFLKILPWLIIVFGAVFLFFLRSNNRLDTLIKPEETRETHRIIVNKIETLGKLELVKYKFKDVVEHTQKFRFIPNTRIILIASGEAVGCIDLSRINSDDVYVNGDSLMINLPAPELCYYKINHQDSKIYDTKFSLLNRTDTLVASAFKKAEKQIKESAISSGILHQTQVNAELILKPMLENMTGKDVFIGFDIKNQRLGFPNGL